MSKLRCTGLMYKILRQKQGKFRYLSFRMWIRLNLTLLLWNISVEAIEETKTNYFFDAFVSSCSQGLSGNEMKCAKFLSKFDLSEHFQFHQTCNNIVSVNNKKHFIRVHSSWILKSMIKDQGYVFLWKAKNNALNNIIYNNIKALN
jgi:hypothetical protein